jgi:hypothetical protein
MGPGRVAGQLRCVTVRQCRVRVVLVLHVDLRHRGATDHTEAKTPGRDGLLQDDDSIAVRGRVWLRARKRDTTLEVHK